MYHAVSPAHGPNEYVRAWPKVFSTRFVRIDVWVFRYVRDLCHHLLHLQHGVQAADPARLDHIYTKTHATLVLTIHALIRLPQKYIGTAKRHIALEQFRISFDIGYEKRSRLLG
jgi:hypothetical protein